MDLDIVETDILVIGAGIAGCRAAIEGHDAGAKVILTTKGLFGKDGAATWMAGNGYQTWGIYSHDTLDVHAEDTIRCGWFLNNQENVYTFLSHVPDTAMELLKWGGRYKMRDYQFATDWTLGCSTLEGRSICPPHGGHGYLCSKVLPRLVRKRKINVIEDMFIIDLVTNGDIVVGAVGIDIRTGRFKVIKAKATILATGGYQGLYKVTTANPHLTGDGQALALRAGVDMMDFEFNQTLPVALWPPAIAGSLLPFGMILWDGHMYNSNNERFMTKWDPVKMERSTRAVISRAIFHEINAGKASTHGGIYVGITHQLENLIEEQLEKMAETRAIYDTLRQYGINLSNDYIETGYAIHYCQGGCNINAKCQTDKPGLFAVGEVASGGKDGADRMMANALPYCMAMGIIAGREAVQRVKTEKMPEIDAARVEELQRRAAAPLERKDGLRVYQVRPLLQNIVVGAIGYGRTEEGLKNALSEVERYKKEVIPKLGVSNKSARFNAEWLNVLEFENIVLVAECIIRNALARVESRGLHDRLDHPTPAPSWYRNIHLKLVDGELKQWTTPVEFKYWQPEEGSLGEPWRRGVQIREYKGWRAEPLYSRM